MHQDTYYFSGRVTHDSCSCDGWFYSKHRYNVRKCRHHKTAFPEQATQNEKIIEGLKGEKAKPKMRVSNEIRDLGKSELEELKGKIESQFGKYPLSLITHWLGLRHRYKEEYTEDEEAQINKMIQDAKALTPQGVEIYASCM